MRSFLRSAAKTGLATLAVGLSISLLSTSVASAAQLNKVATFTDSSNNPITGTQASTTPFNLRLPPTRQVTDLVITSGSTTVTSATANFIDPADVGRTISANSRLSAADATVTSGSTTVTSATANFQSSDVGLTITDSAGAIPSATTISAVTNSTTATISKNGTATVSGTDKLTVVFPAVATTPATAPFVDQIMTITNSTTAVLANPATSSGTVTATIFGAACSGDNPHGFTVGVFLVPASLSSTITSLAMSGGSPANPPSGGGGYALVGSDGSALPVVFPSNTTNLVPPNTVSASQFGPLVSADGITVSGDGDSLVPPANAYSDGAKANWLAGVACLNGSNAITDFWTAPVTFTLDGTDGNGFTWAPTPPPPMTPESPMAIGLPVGAAFLFGGAAYLNRRRRVSGGGGGGIASTV